MLLEEEYKRGVELACEQAFKLLKNSLEEWDTKDPTDQYYYRQNISMMFYNLVFKYGSVFGAGVLLLRKCWGIRSLCKKVLANH